MARSLFVCAIVLLVLAFIGGCARSDPFSPTVDPAGFREVLLISRFNDVDTVIVNRAGFRVGRYYDFSPYDYLSISFSARRLAGTPGPDRISLRIGPASYFTDSISVPQRSFSFRISRSDLSKPHSSAVTFIVPDSGTALLLSNLRVVGLAP